MCRSAGSSGPLLQLRGRHEPGNLRYTTLRTLAKLPIRERTVVFDDSETKFLREARTKAGLEILFARREPGDGLDGVPDRDVPSELRERYWIEKAENAGGGARWLTLAISTPLRIERHQLGRNRNQPGDGFRYIYRAGTDGIGSRSEWFEVTEVFEGVEPKDIEAFMRVNNGGTADPSFDPDRFLKGLDMGRPRRAAQRRAADRVTDAIEKKMNKASYEGMWPKYGYGTLIVGLPLWFATPPTDPSRVENVVDDFMTRVNAGLKPYARQLKRKSCPFWRIVVVWMASLESLREMRGKAKFDVYDDPANRRMGNLPIKLESLPPFQLDFVSMIEEARRRGGKGGGIRLCLPVSVPKKRGDETGLQLPPLVSALKQALEGRDANTRMLGGPVERVRWRAMQRGMEVLCFVRVHGLAGLRRWAATKLSPHRRIRRWVIRSQAHRLYRASRHRQDVASDR